MMSSRHVLAVISAAAVVAGAFAVPGAAAADVVPDELVYAGDDSLHVLNLTTKEDSALPATGGAGLAFTAVSPDRTKIAYCEDVGGPACQVQVYDRATAKKQAVAGIADGYLSPEWSPDGTHLLIAKPVTGIDDPWRLYVQPISGAAARLIPNSRGIYDASYSPSGQQIVFTELKHVAATEYREFIGVMDSDGSSRTPLGLAGHDPVWSPDGRSIAYVTDLTWSDGTLSSSALVTMNARGQNRHMLDATLHADEYLVRPEWRSDSSTIYYGVYPPSSPVRYIEQVDRLGTHREAVTTPGGPTELFPSYAGPPAAIDATAPTIGQPRLTMATGKVTFTWLPLADDDAVAVRVAVRPGTFPPATYAQGTRRANVLGGARSTSVTGLTTGAVYSFSVWALDASGHLSTPRTGTFRSLGTPRLTAPKISALGSTGLPFKVAWSSSGGATSVQLLWGEWHSSNGSVGGLGEGRWTTGRPSGTAVFGARGAPTVVRQGYNYTLRAVALDEFGNRAPGALSRVVVPLDDRTLTRYSSGWTHTRAAGRWMSTMSSTRTGASVTLSFPMRSFTVIGDRLPTGSQVRVYVDGRLKATFSTRGRTALRQALWTSPVLGPAGYYHTVKLVNVPSRQTAADNLHLDALAVVLV
jgi:hypothetical protein